MKTTDKQKRALWAQRIKEWKATSKSGAGWCRENSYPYGTFLYWVHKLKEADQPVSFVELQDSKRQGISIEYAGFTIRLEHDFCHVTFKKLIALLKLC